MANAKDLRRIALSLEGTTEAPHFDRAAFKVTRIYVTLAADGRTANFKFTPDEQELKCLLAPEAFAPVPNAWGQQGWTTAKLSALSTADLEGRAGDGLAACRSEEAAAQVGLHCSNRPRSSGRICRLRIGHQWRSAAPFA